MKLAKYFKGLLQISFLLNRNEKKRLLLVLLKYITGKGKKISYKIIDLKNNYNQLCINDSSLSELKHVNYILIKNDPVLRNVLIKLRPYTSDVNVFIQIFGSNQEYNGMVSLVKEHSQINDVKVIIDAGANVGFASIFFKRNYPAAKIFAIEPDKNNISQAQTNFELNKLNDIELLPFGLWYRKSKLRIENNFRDGSNWAFNVVEDEGGNINSISLEDLMAQYRIDVIDILKMDIEGSEKYIFENLAKFSFLKKTRFLALEIHDEFGCRELIYDILSEYGFIYVESGEGIIGYNNISK